jgi:hypothetical protein
MAMTRVDRMGGDRQQTFSEAGRKKAKKKIKRAVTLVML